MGARRRRIAVRLAVLVWLALVLRPSGLSAQPYSPSTGVLEVGDPSPQQGASTSVAGRGCQAGAQVEVLLDTTILGTVRADENGVFSQEITIPGDAAPGVRTLRANCTARDGQSLNLTTDVNVVSQGSDAAPSPTGAPASAARNRGLSLPFVVGGTAIVALLGAATLALVRRLES